MFFVLGNKVAIQSPYENTILYENTLTLFFGKLNAGNLVDVGFRFEVWQETYITKLTIKLWCECWIPLWSVARNLYNKPEDKVIGVDVGSLSGVWQETFKTNLRIKLWCECWIPLWSVAGNL